MRRIYISLPISGRDEEVQRKRASELAKRIEEKGWEAINPFDIADDLRNVMQMGEEAVEPTYNDFLAEDLAWLLESDGILIDADTKSSYGCSIELAVAQVMAVRKKKFIIYHTREQWHEVKNKYII